MAIDWLYYGNKNKQTFGKGGETTSWGKCLASALGPMDMVIANKFIKTLSVAEEPLAGTRQIKTNDKKDNMPLNDIFKTGVELMYGGQGKIINTSTLRGRGEGHGLSGGETGYRGARRATA